MGICLACCRSRSGGPAARPRHDRRTVPESNAESYRSAEPMTKRRAGHADRRLPPPDAPPAGFVECCASRTCQRGVAVRPAAFPGRALIKLRDVLRSRAYSMARPGKTPQPLPVGVSSLVEGGLPGGQAPPELKSEGAGPRGLPRGYTPVDRTTSQTLRAPAPVAAGAGGDRIGGRHRPQPPQS